MEIRLVGESAEIRRALASLEAGFDVRSSTPWVPIQGSTRLGRVYVDAVPRRVQKTADRE